MSYCIDANVFITVWHVTYPRKIFPTLYRAMGNKLPGNIILIKPIFDQIEPVSGRKDAQKLQQEHPVRLWLKEDMGINETPIDDKVRQKALELMAQYETDEYSKGADEKDVILIAFALLGNHAVVTLEEKQKQLPAKKSNYKIPLICQIENVECISFVELLGRCNISV